MRSVCRGRRNINRSNKNGLFSRHRREPVLNVSVVHRFGGGVTLEWLVERITKWDAMLKEQRRAMRRANKVAVAARLTRTVH